MAAGDARVEVSSMERDAREILAAVKPEWSPIDVSMKTFDDGITNKVFGFFPSSQADLPVSQRDFVMFRVFGEGSEKIIDRENEYKTMIRLHQVGLGPEVYCRFQNGLVYGFIKGDPLTADSCRDENIQQLVAAHFAQWHFSIKALPGENTTEPLPLRKIASWLQHLTDIDRFKITSDLVVNHSFLEKELESLTMNTVIDEPLVFSHNDTLLANIIHDEKTQSVRLIDFEYGGFSNRAFDIGNHFDEMCGIGDTTDFSVFPQRDEQIRFIRKYLEAFNVLAGISPPSEEDVVKMYRDVGKMCLLSHFFWGVWSLLQSKISKIDFDYTEYARIKLEEYFKRKHEFLNLE